MRILVNILLVLLVAIFWPCSSHAGLLDNCVKGFDFGDPRSKMTLRVTPMNKSCYERCEETCKSLISRKSPNTENGVELNDGPLYECNRECRSGGRLVPSSTGNGSPTMMQTRKYIIRHDYATPPANNKFSGYAPKIRYITVQTSRICSQGVVDLANDISNINAYFPSIPDSGAVRSDFPVKKGEKISVKMLAPKQVIHRCGRKNVRLEPMIRSQDSAVWNNNSTQTIWADRSEHQCLVNMSDSDWGSLRNTDLWASRMGSDICSWHVRNPNYVETGIYAKDGDDLSIVWDSDISIKNLNLGFINFTINLTRKEIFRAVVDNTNPGLKSTYLQLLEEMGNLKIHPAAGNAQNIVPNNTATDLIKGEESRMLDYSSYEDAILNIGKQRDPNNQNVVKPGLWNELQGVVEDRSVIVSKLNKSGCKDEEIIDFKSYNDCHETQDPGLPFYNYSGRLDKFSSSPSPLGVKHPAMAEALMLSDGNQPNVIQSIQNGGVTATIDWAGCPIEDGEGLQYCIYLLSNKTQTIWKDVPKAVLDGTDKITIPYDGELVFRIKPLDATGPSFLEKMYSPLNYFGDYNIVIEPENKDLGTGYYNPDGPLRKLVQTVHETLFGIKKSNGKMSGGVVEEMYTKLIKDSQLIRITQAFVTIYLMFFGLGFMIGTIEAKQQDLIVRVVKIAFVLAVIDPNSWRLFYDNLFAGAIEGGIELMAMVVVGSLDRFPGNSLTSSEVEQDPTVVFSIFDGLISQLGSEKIWKKIGTLLFLGFIGFALMLIIMIAIGLYALAVLKAALTYMMSIVIVSILLFATPIFMPMMLFQTTKGLFDSWWKMIISFTLQPVGMFAGIAIFNTLFAATIYATLSYTICPYCAVAVEIPGIDTICLLTWYQPISDSFTPDEYETSGFSTPMSILQGAMLLLILGHGMLKYCDFITKVIGNIVSGELTSRSSDASQFSGQAGAMFMSGVNKVTSAPMLVQDARIKAAELKMKFQKGARDGQKK